VSYSAVKRQVAGMNTTHNLFGVSVCGRGAEKHSTRGGLDTLRGPRRDSGGEQYAMRSRGPPPRTYFPLDTGLPGT
jgi:hypothetical protein